MGQKGHGFLKGFVQLISNNYGAGMQFVDFGRSEEARIMINDWVTKNTHGRIEDLIPAGVINTKTRLVVSNAVYFKGLWVTPFKKRNTRQARFTLIGGGRVVVPTMGQVDDFRYAERPGCKALEMPYKECDIAMLVLLPTDPAGLSGLEKSLTLDEVNRCIANLATHKVSLQLPKAKMLESLSLARTLNAMGMPHGFAKADFSGMDGAKDLFISDVLHKALVNIDEEGTEAAAATAVPVAAAEGFGEEIKEFIADHPFIFLIRERQSGAILFMGRMMSPRS
jgi:serine protease inhibitor